LKGVFLCLPHSSTITNTATGARSDLAVQMSRDAAREQLVRMADEYDRLADLAAQRGKNVRANS
jgi:hypothetical protein